MLLRQSPSPDGALTTGLTFEEVYLSVSAPDERGVNVVGDAREALGYVLRVTVVHRGAVVPPVFLTLEEVRVARLVRERRVQVARQPGPRSRDGLGKSLCEPVVCQFPVVVACGRDDAML